MYVYAIERTHESNCVHLVSMVCVSVSVAGSYGNCEAEGHATIMFTWCLVCMPLCVRCRMLWPGTVRQKDNLLGLANFSGVCHWASTESLSIKGATTYMEPSNPLELQTTELHM